MTNNYKNKKIVIVGLGLTGLSCVNFFLARGVIPYVIETRLSSSEVDKLPEQIICNFGNLNDQWLKIADLIVLSPGIALTHPSLRAAIKAGIEIVGDIELFCREMIQAPIVAITGSNGKSTVTALVGEMAKAAGVHVGVGGNIGFPALTLLDSLYELYVLELSSFQLETTISLQATVATILNVTEDHLDRYPLGFQQYHAAKLRIYENAKICVINTDDVLTIPIYKTYEHCLTFGVNTGDFNLKSQCGETWLCMKEKKLLNVKEMMIFGQHNYINALAAFALANAVGLPNDSNLKVLRKFVGLSHRFQIVLERNGVRWINDSKSTNVSSTKAAINSVYLNNVNDMNGTLHLLLGGDGKSTDFSSLKSHLMHENIRLYCFGQDRYKLAMLRPEVTEITNTMEQAIRLLVSHTKPGDVVLLSPACSSFDQFKNFEQRGDTFSRLAKELG